MSRIVQVLAIAAAVISIPVPTGALPPPAVEADADPLPQELVWAGERFTASGLEMPSVEVVQHDDRDDCSGHPAVYRHIGEGEIHLCLDLDSTSGRRTLLHELAHAWVDEHLDDDERAAFLDLRGLDEWSEPAPWYLRGGEHAAEIIAWALMDIDLPVLTVAPNDQASLRVAFELLRRSA